MIDIARVIERFLATLDSDAHGLSPEMRALVKSILDEVVHEVNNLKQMLQTQNDVIRMLSAKIQNDVARLDRLLDGMQVK